MSILILKLLSHFYINLKFILNFIFSMKLKLKSKSINYLNHYLNETFILLKKIKLNSIKSERKTHLNKI